MAHNSKAASCNIEFHGTELYSKDWGGVVLHASQYRPGAYIQQHKHTHAYACFLAKGILHERVKNCTSSFLPNTLILHPAGTIHEDRFEGHGLCIDLQFTSKWLKQTLDTETAVLEQSVSDRGHMFCLGIRLFHLFMHRETTSHLEIEELALALLEASHSAQVQSTHQPSWIPAILEQIEAELTIPRSLSEWAQLAGVHPVYLARAFRKARGMSLGQYQRYARIRKAIELMTHSKLSISQIAYDCGFTDQSHFTHMLKRFTRFSPGNLKSSLLNSYEKVRCIQDERTSCN